MYMNRKKRYSGFTLLEVIVAMSILAVSVAVVLTSFTQSIRASKKNRIKITSVALAERILQEFELNAEFMQDDEYDGEFGDNFENYSWRVLIESDKVEYENEISKIDQEKLKPIRFVNVDIFYEDRNLSFNALSINTCFLGNEKFTYKSKDLAKLY